MGIEVVRYSERPELWEQLHGLAEEVWPEYSLHGDVINQYWARLYEAFPEWQFAIYDDSDKTALAEGQTIPVSWDGTDDGLPHPDRPGAPEPQAGLSHQSHRTLRPLDPPRRAAVRPVDSRARPAGRTARTGDSPLAAHHRHHRRLGNLDTPAVPRDRRSPCRG